MFSTTSRYHGIETTRLTRPDGREIAYARRRFLPPGPPATVGTEHTVTQGERLDNITARHLGDPERFWQICDANEAMRPAELTVGPGRRLVIPLPQGGI
ncbi:LysM peptidoglycan-binding domain-containing protein [Streptomyces phaeochromogenes]|uniref:LysM peptidoglycan-binding domain-containing protein n=1 Tax=Streptomyces phaeochromogenes TaxID=1923 RepID=UPI003695E569